ncbi:MAG: DNA repair protein RecO [Candidatus Omnitrophica bacterium]|nr:DNA repair protein RecO [Candidatus Omnitrophota bacterium]
MSIHKTEAIVLNRYDSGETSIIANLYTKDFGKIGGILKGIRQDPLRFASRLDLFSHNEIVFYKKRSSALHLISQCDLKNNFDRIRLDLNKVSTAHLMIELLNMIMSQEDKNEEVFNLILDALLELDKGNDADKIATIFKIKLLGLSGFRPHFESCVSCGSKLDAQAKFSLMLGGLLCQRCHKRDIKARPIFRGTIASILHIQKNIFRDNLTLGMNPLIKKELCMILNAFINNHLGKELKVQRFIDKVGNTAMR